MVWQEQVQLKDDALEELQHLLEAETRKNQNLWKEMQRQIAQKEEQEKSVRAARQRLGSANKGFVPIKLFQFGQPASLPRNLLEQKHLRLMNDSAGVGRHL